MDVREHYLKRIIRHLSYLKNEVELSVSLNLTNINIHAENFYRDFFNLIGFSFNNTNYDNKNAAYVDLIDTINKEAIQVTAQNDNAKILKSIQGFFKNEVYKDYHLQEIGERLAWGRFTASSTAKSGATHAISPRLPPSRPSFVFRYRRLDPCARTGTQHLFRAPLSDR